MTKQERIALSRYADYQRSNATDLSDVYGRYSTAKARAWNYCKDLMVKHDGWGLRIISHNTSIFTAGFLFRDPETDALKFMYITKSYDQAVKVWAMYKVTMSSGCGTDKVFQSGLTNKEAFDLCVMYNWHWTDENGFDWYLIIEDDG